MLDRAFFHSATHHALLFWKSIYRGKVQHQALNIVLHIRAFYDFYVSGQQVKLTQRFPMDKSTKVLNIFARLQRPCCRDIHVEVTYEKQKLSRTSIVKRKQMLIDKDNDKDNITRKNHHFQMDDQLLIKK